MPHLIAQSNIRGSFAHSLDGIFETLEASLWGSARTSLAVVMEKIEQETSTKAKGMVRGYVLVG